MDQLSGADPFRDLRLKSISHCVGTRTRRVLMGHVVNVYVLEAIATSQVLGGPAKCGHHYFGSSVSEQPPLRHNGRWKACPRDGTAFLGAHSTDWECGQPESVEHKRIGLETGRNAAPSGRQPRRQSARGSLCRDVSRLERAHPRCWRDPDPSPLLGTALTAAFRWLQISWPDCCTVGEWDLATVVRQPDAPISS